MAGLKALSFSGTLCETDTNDISRGPVQQGRMRYFSLPAPTLAKSDEVAEDAAKYRYGASGWPKSRGESIRSPGQLNNTDKERDISKDTLQFASRLPVTSWAKYPTMEPIRPRPHKAKIVIWSELTLDAIGQLNEHHTYDSVKKMLAKIFMLDKYDLKEGIILDLYYYTLDFARQENFSPEKTSTLFAIIRKIFEVCTETPYGNLDYTYNYFKELLLCHSVDRPPISIELFTPDEVVRIANYTLNTFFRHFKMYKFVFTPEVRRDITLKYIGTLSSPQPSEAEVDVSTILDDDEVTLGDKELESEEIDHEKLVAEAELRNLVTDFLTKEAKKIEGNIEQHLKEAIETLNAKIDPLLETGRKSVKGKKK